MVPFLCQTRQTSELMLRREGKLLVASALALVGCSVLVDQKLDEKTETGSGGSTVSAGGALASSQASGGAAQASSVTSTVGSGGGAFICGADPTQPMGSCPGACSDCDTPSGTCFIDCPGNALCMTGMIDCPPGWGCTVRCQSNNACKQKTITCPDDYPCRVLCQAQSACAPAMVNCSDAGTCEVQCGPDTNACDGLTVNCGSDNCTGTCTSGVTPPIWNCATMYSCECHGCS